MELSFKDFTWINKPDEFTVNDDNVEIKTLPVTDFWQRTYYNFRHNNAHAFVKPIDKKEFSLFVKAEFVPTKLFDQCGIVIYEDEDNWAKASCEYEAEGISNLGSVVTNLGYSDWSAHPIVDKNHVIYYRISRRGQDFEIRTSFDGKQYDFMRIFHMHKDIDAVNIGIYACSPLITSVTCKFSKLQLTDCKWDLYKNPDENN